MRFILLAAALMVFLPSFGYCQNTRSLLDQISKVQTDSGQTGNDLIAGFSFAGIMGGILFASIGFVALIYGKRVSEYRPVIIGALLMGYPYFVKNTVALFTVGIALTVALFVWKD